jgi:glycine betaine transporter
MQFIFIHGNRIDSYDVRKLKTNNKNSILISKPFGHIRSNSLLFYGALFAVFSFIGLLAPALLTGLNELNKKLLSYFSTYYLWVGLITVLRF